MAVLCELLECVKGCSSLVPRFRGDVILDLRAFHVLLLNAANTFTQCEGCLRIKLDVHGLSPIFHYSLHALRHAYLAEVLPTAYVEERHAGRHGF